MKNIVWILLDSLRPDKLNLKSPQNYIEKIVSRGKVYSNIICAEKFSLGAAYCLGTGFNGSINGMKAHDYDHSKENPKVLTVGDYLKNLGYKTFHYSDYKARHLPSSGMDLYETTNQGDATLKLHPAQTFDIPLRRKIINDYNKCNQLKFIFLHLMTLHDKPPLIANGRYKWSTEVYHEGIDFLSKDFQIVMNKLKLSDDDLLVVFSDHGMILDDFLVDKELKDGPPMEMVNIRTFVSFISKNIKPSIINTSHSSIDILPSTFELAGLPRVPVLGKSLISEGGTLSSISEGVAMFEYPFDQMNSAVYSITNKEWKLVKCKGKKDRLYDMKDNKEILLSNLKHQSIINKLSNEIDTTLNQSAKKIRIERIKHYNSKGEDVIKLVPEELPCETLIFVKKIDYELYKNLRSQIDHYFHVHAFCEIYNPDNDHRFIFHDSKISNKKIIDIINLYKNVKYACFISTGLVYYDDLLYKLKRIIQTKKTEASENIINSGKVTLYRIAAFKRHLYGKKIETVKYKYNLFENKRKFPNIIPLDEKSKELLDAEKIQYSEKSPDLCITTNIKNLELAKKFNALSVFIDLDINGETALIKQNSNLCIIKRRDIWFVLTGKWRGIFSSIYHNKLTKWCRKRWLYDALLEVYDYKLMNTGSVLGNILIRDFKFMLQNLSKIPRFYFRKQAIKFSLLPIFKKYKYRKLLYSKILGIKILESRPPVIKRQNP